jgi:tmRNA-binding protein
VTATKVTATHPEQGEQTIEIEDNYVLICDGSAYVSGVTVHQLKDGTQTHVITVKGIRA